MPPKELSDIRRKLKVLNYATEIGNAAAAAKILAGLPKQTLRLTPVATGISWPSKRCGANLFANSSERAVL